MIPSDGWEIVGDLMRPATDGSMPAVLLLNAAAGTRSDYDTLASRLARHGLASLRVDLRAHGESTNLGSFVPGGPEATAILNGTDHDVIAALHYLKDRDDIDSTRIAVVGASYSGESMAEAGRRAGYVRAYVALSPGSFSTESAHDIDGSGAAWLFIRSRDEPVDWVRIAIDSVSTFSQRAEVWIVPGTEHATRMLPVQPGLTDRIASWIATQLAG